MLFLWRLSQQGEAGMERGTNGAAPFGARLAEGFAQRATLAGGRAHAALARPAVGLLGRRAPPAPVAAFVRRRRGQPVPVFRVAGQLADLVGNGAELIGQICGN